MIIGRTSRRRVAETRGASPHADGLMHAPSTRGRKRKNQSHGLPWDPSNAARANMPRASGVPGAQTPILKRPYYNLITGREPDEDIADAVVGKYGEYTHN